MPQNQSQPSYSKMKNKQLGAYNINISSIGLGTNFVSDIVNDQQKIIYLIQRAFDNNINIFDTAEAYHNGYSELLIGKALKKKRANVIIATKFSSEHSRYKDVLKAAEGSLKRLQTDYIDLYQIHWPNPVVPIEETLQALEKLVNAGKVKYIGVCNFSLRQLKDIQKASTLPIVSLQTEYNLLERSAEQYLLPYAQKNNITVIAYTPLNSGNILRKEKYAKIFSTLAKKYNKTPSQIILNFLISRSPVVAIPATTSITHLQENAKSDDFVLEKKDVQLLEKTFITKLTHIEPAKIRVANVVGHNAYKTLSQALVNKLNFFPSPQMLSVDIQKGDFLKPVKVRKLSKKDGNFEYELSDGRIRYWAWVIAFNGKKTVPTILEE